MAGSAQGSLSPLLLGGVPGFDPAAATSLFPSGDQEGAHPFRPVVLLRLTKLEPSASMIASGVFVSAPRFQRKAILRTVG